MTAFPTLLTPLIGREQDIADLGTLLTASASRLVTVTGPGGIGKTRLAIAAATTLAETAGADAAGDAVFVPLAAIADASLVLPAIAQALDVRQIPGKPVPESLELALRNRRLLVVLDNAERVVTIAPDLARLLEVCPGLTLLITSREPLRLGIEHRFVATPLALPPSATNRFDEIATYPAIALFIARARAVCREFALGEENADAVVAICRKLDGLPLAIELAAAWARVLSPAAILRGLEHRWPLLHGGPADQPARLRTMHDAIAWSYDVLPEDEARLFRRLSVFVGGFSLDMADRVAAIGSRDRGADSSRRRPPSDTRHARPDTLSIVAALVDRSLVQPMPGDVHAPRFQMLETIRHFGLEQLRRHGEMDDVAAGHAAAMREFAAGAEPHLLGPEERYWQTRVGAEIGNLRLALTWGLDHDVDTAPRIGAALWVYWVWHNLVEGRRWLGAVLAGSTGTTGIARARALVAGAALDSFAGDVSGIDSAIHEALALARAGEDPVTEGEARWISAAGSLMDGRYADGIPDLDRALVLLNQATTTTDRAWAAYARSHRGAVAMAHGDDATGFALYDEAAAEARAAGSDGITAIVLGDFASWLIDRGDTVRARGLLREALTCAADHPCSWLPASALVGLTMIDVLDEKWSDAARLLGVIDVMRAEGNLSTVPAHYAARVDQAASLARDHLGAARFEKARALGRTGRTGGYDAILGEEVNGRVGSRRQLSPRERDVLRLLAEGMTDKAIAAVLAISSRTVSHHVAAILHTLGAESRTAAVALALRHELV